MGTTKGIEMTDDRRVALEAARAGAELVRSRFGGRIDTSFKGEVDPVTDVDRAAERAILDTLHRFRPDDAVLAEEGGRTGRLRGRVWIVDPLDGTVNFLHGIPHVGVSVALWEDGTPKVGVVVDAIGGDEYVAAVGEGTTRSGTPVTVSARPLSDGLVATGFPYDRRDHAADYAATVGAVLRRAQGIRRFGAATLDFCWVADGRFAGFWEFGLAPWDVAAGILLVTEAGGIVTDLDGNPAGLESNAWVVTNGVAHEELLRTVAEHRPRHLR